jgi:DMSO/TMAO reductase YedYZ molybdopterin-dependent catalytic subunit
MRASCLFLILCMAAAGAPILPRQATLGDEHRLSFPGWPDTYEGRSLKPLSLTDRETRFLTGFPGKMAKFTDGSRLILLRWVSRSTRKLHPAVDCFRGAGHSVRPSRILRDSAGKSWGCFIATKGKESVRVLEQIYDSSGRCWSDVSAWYWDALMKRSYGPWWAVTIVESRPIHEAVQPHHVDRPDSLELFRPLSDA